jgi:hypothetical protein
MRTGESRKSLVFQGAGNRLPLGVES